MGSSHAMTAPPRGELAVVVRVDHAPARSAGKDEHALVGVVNQLASRLLRLRFSLSAILGASGLVAEDGFLARC